VRDVINTKEKLRSYIMQDIARFCFIFMINLLKTKCNLLSFYLAVLWAENSKVRVSFAPTWCAGDCREECAVGRLKHDVVDYEH
jgi:hypothetical protein